MAQGYGYHSTGVIMGNDITGSSVDGNGDTMEEELALGKNEFSLLEGKPRFALVAAGDLID